MMDWWAAVGVVCVYPGYSFVSVMYNIHTILSSCIVHIHLTRKGRARRALTRVCERLGVRVSGRFCCRYLLPTPVGMDNSSFRPYVLGLAGSRQNL